MATRTARPVPRSISAVHAEWLSLLESSGPFLSVPVLVETDGFRQGLPESDSDGDLRRDTAIYYGQWLTNSQLRKPDPALDRAWFQVVIQDVLEWIDLALEGQSIPPGLDLTHPEYKETLRPDLVVRNPGDGGEIRVLVQRYPSGQGLGKPVENSRWSESPANRMADLLHHTNVRLGLVTNGEEWMLVNAPVGEPTGFTSWYAGLWFDEPVTFAAFRALLGIERLVGVPDDQTLEQMLVRSAEDQASVTTQLGDQVRQAIELLVAGIDREDQERHGTLLKNVSEAEVYESAITVMMRLVFLLFAEDQRPPLFGDNDGVYDQNYSVSGLIQQLEEMEQTSGGEILEQKKDAWPRLLSTFRLVYAGSAHDYMRQPAYGGSLFNPDRFPFLEGRVKGSHWETEPAKPLPLNNRTVLHMLQAIQFIEMSGKGLQGRQRLSFRALDVEQIGHVYEQLLEHTGKCSVGPVLGLTGTSKKGVKDEPEIELSDLESWRAKGEASLLKQLKETTGRSESALKKALVVDLDLFQQQRLRLACVTDDLYQRVLPFAGLIREDRAGRPLVIRPGGLYVTRGDDRSTTGAHYTPRSLTESIVQHALEPLVYDGPADGKPREEWRLHSPKHLLELNVCDPAMGSGAFLVQACRYLSERLVEAWGNVAANELLASALDGATPFTSANPIYITPDGSLSRGNPSELILPQDKGERLAIARYLVADHCLYGVDVNPLAVDMAKLSLWLVTLQKDRPFTFLDHRLRCGDSLLGISEIDQLRYWTLDTNAKNRQLPTFAEQFRRAMEQATSLRQKIEAIDVHDVHDTEQQARLQKQAEQLTGVLRLGGDLIIAAQLHPEKKMRETLRGEFRDRFSVVVDGLGQLQRGDLTKEGQQRVFEGMEALGEEANRWLDGKRPFHWPLEFPEILVSAGTYEAPEGFSAIIGNPPFLGGKKITGALGSSYRDHLLAALARGTKGNADLSSYFLLRCGRLLQNGGSLAMLTTNTIAQGETREVGLDQLVVDGFTIQRAVSSRPWPGTAALEVSHLWLRRGNWSGSYILDEEPVNKITPYLTVPGRVEGKPHSLLRNSGKSFVGSYPLGKGFLLSKAEASAMILQDLRNKDVLLPYLVGEDLNSRPQQEPSRWIVDFKDWPLERAMQYTEPFRHLERTVKPERLSKAKDVASAPWWHFWRTRKELYNAIDSLDRVFGVAITGTYHPIVSICSSNLVIDQTVIVIACDTMDWFACLNSSLHQEWAAAQSSSMGSAYRYIHTDAFVTFPFPDSAPDLHILGNRFDCQRKGVSDRYQIGLTALYNRINDQREVSKEYSELRNSQVEIDGAIVAAYGWDDLDLEHDFHQTKQGLRFTISEAARREVLDRLLELNHQRYAEEVEQGLHDKGKGGTRKQAASASTQKTVF